MPYVTVDIDLDDIETSDMCKELSRRLDNNKRMSGMSMREHEYLKNLAKSLGTAFVGGLPSKTLEDRLKIEWLAANWDKFNSWDLEKKLL